MHLVIVCGSRNPKGQTARAAAALVEGAAENGCSIETVFLPMLRIERCRQCGDDGWGGCRDGRQCDIDDDFMGVVEKLRRADAIVFANPVFFSDLSESLRTFLDRLRRLCVHGAQVNRIADKPVVGVCVAGGSGGGAPKALVNLESILTTCGFDVVDVVPVRRQNLDMKMQVLRTVGRWLTNGLRS